MHMLKYFVIYFMAIKITKNGKSKESIDAWLYDLGYLK